MKKETEEEITEKEIIIDEEIKRDDTHKTQI